MAYTYIDISNRILNAIGEVPFSDATEFSNDTGFHTHVKNSVNFAIADIYAEEDNEWAFQKTDETQVLTIGISDYSINSNAANVDWGSFYIDKVFGDESDFTSVTADSGTKTFTIGGGSFTDEGFAVGMKVQWGNLESNTGSDLTINTLTDTVMTVDEAVTTISSADTNFTVANAFEGPNSVKLTNLALSTYRDNYKVNALNADDSDSFTKPDFVVRNTDNSYTLGPIKPNRTYLVKYVYFTQFTELSANDDAPSVPQRYEQVIIDGALKYAHDFRDNEELSRKFEERFDKGINKMRRNLIPQATEMRFVP